MRRILHALIITLFAFTSFAQSNEGGLPPSFGFDNLPGIIDIREISKPDMNMIAYYDSMDYKNSNPYRIGVNIPVNLTMKNSGTWTELPDHSGRIWRLCVTSPDAHALTVYYSSFYLPAGSRLFLYNGNKKQILGAFTDLDNPESGNFATEMTLGDVCTLEYFEPAGLAQEAVIDIEEMCYIYRGETRLNSSIEQFALSDPCEVNINCTPEGSNWQTEKKGVCRIQIKIGSGTFLCTGALLNNKRNECIPYVLTADHCSYDGGYATATDLNYWIFYFHYEASTCSGTTASGTVTKTGCTLKAHDTFGSNNYGSDFFFVQLKQNITTANNLYYNGWSRSGTASTSGVGIHHPSGDIMKISTYTSTLTSVNVGYGLTGSHWQVKWATTTNGHGVTEPGSSGSPLFNSSGLIIGTLTGGLSCCTSNGCGTNTGPAEPDYYGKFLHHWSSDGTTSAKQLKPWLDPDNTGATMLTGSATCVPVGIEESYRLTSTLNVFPNPASDVLNISVGENTVKDPTVKIYSLLGDELYKRTFPGEINTDLAINIQRLPAGLYFISVQAGNAFVTKKFTIQR